MKNLNCPRDSYFLFSLCSQCKPTSVAAPLKLKLLTLIMYFTMGTIIRDAEPQLFPASPAKQTENI